MAAEDKQIPAQSRLFLDANRKLGGFGRERFIAESADNREIMGYAQIWRAPWTPPGCLSTLFYVAPEHRGKGVGTALLTHLLQWAKSQQADTVMSELKDWVPHTLDFAVRHGFTLDAHIYELHLDVGSIDASEGSAGLSSLEQSGIATALKLLSIEAVKKLGAHTLSTETEAKNSPMQAVNRKLRFAPGKGHYRVILHLHSSGE